MPLIFNFIFSANRTGNDFLAACKSLIDIESFQGLLSLGRNEDFPITVSFQNLSNSYFLIHLLCVYIDFCSGADIFFSNQHLVQ